MKAVDTNVLVRLLTNDHPTQANAAAQEMRTGPIFISATVFMETEWVLRFAYEFDREQVCAALLAVVNLAGAVIDGEPEVRTALRWHAQGMDLADALHLARLEHVDEFVTFDRKFARKANSLAATPPVRLLS